MLNFLNVYECKDLLKIFLFLILLKIGSLDMEGICNIFIK